MLIAMMVLIARVGTAEALDFKTMGVANGRGWAAMDGLARTMYVQGFTDAMAVAEVNGFDKNAAKFYSCKCTVGETVEAVTALYAADAAYARVPVYIMLGAYAERTRGASRDAIDKMISGFLTALRKTEEQ